MGLHQRADEIYRQGEMALATSDAPSTAEVEEAFNSAMEWLHGNRLFSGAMLTEEPVRSLIDTTSSYLYKGIDSGLEQSTPSELLVSKLKESARVFSGFKTLHEMNEAAALLLDEKGYIKPFERFSKDVQTINAKYNKSYLRTEYEFAMSSSQMAAKWEEQQDDDNGRYLLQYRTMGDNKVRADHVKLNGVTLAPSDPFWDSYYPPNGWGCRCTVVKVRAAKYPATDSEEAMTAGAEATKGKYADMFRFNPGKQKTAYPAHNSYTISKCSTCSKSGLELAKAPSNELCAACPIIRECADYTVVPTKRGKLRVHKMHGVNEYDENVNIASYFTNKYEHNIELLPRSNKKKCADVFNRTLGQEQEYKLNTRPTKSAIDNQLRDADSKSDHVVLVIESEIDEDTLTRGIKGRLSQSTRLQTVTIVRNGKDIILTKDDIIRNDFKASWAELK